MRVLTVYIFPTYWPSLYETIRYDADLVEKALSNAFKFTPGGGEITV